jgi:hypothetical protein
MSVHRGTLFAGLIYLLIGVALVLEALEVWTLRIGDLTYLGPIALVAVGLAVVVIPVLGLVIVPVYLLAALLFFGMTLAGWITVTLVVGDLILRRLQLSTLPPLVITAVGNVALLLVWNVLALTDFTRLLGLLGLIGLGSVGLGAAFVTRMGTKPVHRSYLVQG